RRGVADVRIRLDDLYPGRPGLTAGFAEVQLVTRAPRTAGRPAR
ncbi:MAG: hypothetical protein JWN17_1129, partial [Frankiales bacterium]|nr:hypothetical protein [Frankiales bacterium]